MHVLKKYLKDSKIDQKDFAIELSISEKHLSHIINGHSGVSLTLGLKIEKATSGKVKASDFIQNGEPETATA